MRNTKLALKTTSFAFRIDFTGGSGIIVLRMRPKGLFEKNLHKEES